MSQKFTLVVSLLLCSSAALAGSEALSCVDFSRFPARDVFAGPSVKPNIGSSPDARRFRTTIRASYTGKPDFAGHFQVVSWGCGSNCHIFALVDTKSGKITFAPTSAVFGAEFHLNSTLFVIDPKAMAEEGDSTPFETSYFIWDEALGDFRSLNDCETTPNKTLQGDGRLSKIPPTSETGPETICSPTKIVGAGSLPG